MSNTKQRGKFIIFVYPKSSKHFIGVNLTFDLIIEGRKAQEALEGIKKASLDYIEAVCKSNLDDSLLNRPAPEKYWNKFNAYLKKLASRKPLVKWSDYFQQEIPYFDKACV